MMDPLTALGLASNVIQLVDFSLKTLTKFRELCNDGVSTENKELEDMAVCLKVFRNHLTAADPTTGRSKDLFDDDRDLQALAVKCCETADELTAELDTLKSSNSRRKLEAIKKTYRTIRRKSIVEKMQRKLDGYRQILETRTLINLRQRLDLVSLQQREKFSTLDPKIQALIVGLAEEKQSFDELSQLIRQKQTSANQHVTKEFRQHRMDVEEKEYCRRFLESISFPDMRARQEIITSPYEETFQWVFDESGKKVRPWGNFAQWLKNGHGTYWIQGKAGSGKSTLMSFIYEESKTKTFLNMWANTRELHIVSFFFWRAGSAFQKTSIGLLRSLLYQILEELPHLIIPLVHSNKDSHNLTAIPQRLPPIPAWTENRLLTTLQTLLVDSLSSHRLCLFIDGLDEIESSQDDLVELIRKVTMSPNIKVCLSSRPDGCFADAFGSPSMLKLEDLTRKDIALYVSRKLQHAPRMKSRRKEDLEWIATVCDSIVMKAQGVFQWVHIVVQYQIEGLRNNDSLRQLEERIKLLPDEIEGLYAHMLERIDKLYRKEAASYFQIVLHVLQIEETPRVSEIALALWERTDGVFSSDLALPLSEIASQCTWIRGRITPISAGLLEVHEDHYFDSWQSRDADVTLENEELGSENEESSSSSAFQRDSLESAKAIFRYNHGLHVQLVHRTALDFLKESPAGKKFLEIYASSSTFDVYESYVDARLAQLVMFAADGFPHYPSRIVDSTSSFSLASGGESGGESDAASLDLPESMVPLSQGSSTASSDSARPVRQLSSEYGLESEVKAMMIVALDVERVTMRAQTALNETIDRVITMLDQQHCSQRPSTHWCTRHFGTMTQEDSISADFLCLAAFHGLYLYVHDVLTSRVERDDPTSMTLLLRLIRSEYDDEHRLWTWYLQLVDLLLKRGANPNIKSYNGDPSTTVWIHFLQNLWELCMNENRQLDDDLGSKRACEEQVAIVARTFLETGADVNANFINWYNDPFAWIVSGDVDTKLQRFRGAEIQAQMSVLACLQDVAVNLPHGAEIRKMCIDRGASWTSRAQALSVEPNHSLQLSKQRSDDFDILILATSSKRAGRPMSSTVEELRAMLVRLYDELGMAEKEARWQAWKQA